MQVQLQDFYSKRQWCLEIYTSVFFRNMSCLFFFLNWDRFQHARDPREANQFR